MMRSTRPRPVLLILALAAPLAAQQGRDLLASEEPLGALSEHVFLKGVPSGTWPSMRLVDISLVEAAVSDPTRVAWPVFFTLSLGQW